MASRLLIGDVLSSAAARLPNNPMVTHRDTTLTFRQADAMAKRIAFALHEKGVVRGDRVIWWGDTCAEAVALFFGLAHLGAVFVPINPAFSQEEAGAIVGRTAPAVVISDERHYGDLSLQGLLDTSDNGRRIDQLPAPAEDDTHIIFFTSGTTGQPKGVELSHRTDVLRSIYSLSGGAPTGAYVCMFPQFHMAGWSAMGRWLRGDEFVYVDRGDPEALLGAVERHRAYGMYCIPAVWRRILELGPHRYDTSSLREADTGTSATSIELLSELRQALPHTTTSIMYGSTEAGAVTQLWPSDVLRKPGSVGPPVPHVFVRLDEGEILVKSPYLMSRYFQDPGATERALSGGWYHTGELGEVDEDGYYRVVGRTKDLIRTGGEWVSPAEVDALLQRHPLIADCAVAGVPHEDWGEVVTAFVVPEDGAHITLEELRQYCDGKIAAYKQPRQLVIVKDIPRTPTTGQIQRRLLVVP
jgi:acyl-CoA synthetase (AMP-forming)/AMP-acid ligase II